MATAAGADTVINYREADVAAAILAATDGGVDHIVEVAFGANLPVSVAVLKDNGIVAAYASDAVERIAKRPTREIAQMLGYSNGDEVIHRDDLVLLEDSSE